MPADTTAWSSLAQRLASQYAMRRAVPAGRAALGLLAVLQGWRGTRERLRVALPAAVCHEVLLAVLAAGCEPWFCDVSPADGLVTPQEWRRAREAGAEVAILVHLYGNPADAQAARRCFPAPQCLLIDDAAQALGAQWRGVACGAGGDVGLLSFGQAKQISLGNAMVLINDPALAAQVETRLLASTASPVAVREELSKEFRRRLDAVRAQLAERGAGVSEGFAGLLQGMEPVLHVPLDDQLAPALMRALDAYPDEARRRVHKASLRARTLEACGLEPVGMADGCIPWRYVCRLPGISWRQQAHLAQAIRAAGIHVSTWYLPAHWFVGQPAGSLPGVETLAREVFQFWVDDSATDASIEREARHIRACVAALPADRKAS